MPILKTLVVKFDATNTSVLLPFCCTIKADVVLLAFTTSNLSVVYTIVSSCVLSPKTIKLELIVKVPLSSKLLLYLLLTINLLAALIFSVIISVVKSVILLEIKLLAVNM